MSKVLAIRAFVNQRLTVAAEEIFELFERTVAEYEEELRGQRKVLEAVLQPEVRIPRADPQLLLARQDEEPSEQLEWSPSLDPEDPPAHIKEEQAELWTRQGEEGEQLQGLEKAEIIDFAFAPVSVKSEVNCDEEPQFPPLHQGGPELVGNFNPVDHLRPDTDDKTSDYFDPDTGGADDWKESSEHQSDEKSLGCPDCGKQFSQISNLKTHMKIHTGDKPFSCLICNKRFIRNGNLMQHMVRHTGEKRYNCSVCHQRFTWHSQLKRHQSSSSCRSQAKENRDAELLEAGGDRENCAGSEPERSFGCTRGDADDIRTRLKPFSCSVSGKRCNQSNSLRTRMRVHPAVKRFSCPVCKKTFRYQVQIMRHLRIHTGEKPFSCSVCGRSFAADYNLTAHLRVHTGEKPFTCSICNTSFSRRHNLSKHMRRHTARKQSRKEEVD